MLGNGPSSDLEASNSIEVFAVPHQSNAGGMMLREDRGDPKFSVAWKTKKIKRGENERVWRYKSIALRVVTYNQTQFSLV